MALETWALFVAASFAMLATPGPITLLVTTLALEFGRKRASFIIPGALLGDLVAMTASLGGVGLLVSRYPAAFTALKLAGAIILFCLGWLTLMRTPRSAGAASAQGHVSPGGIFWSGFALAALHPGGLVFFVAFAPHFIAPERPFLSQAITLIITFLAIGGLTLTAWLAAAHAARRLLMQPKHQALVRRASGAFLMALGVITCAQTL